MKDDRNDIYYSCERCEKTNHRHSDHQILLIVKGEIVLSVNGMKLYARKGDVVIFSRFENHSIQVLSEEYERYVLNIPPTESIFTSRLYALLTNRPAGFSNVISTSEEMESFVEIFYQLLEEENRKDRFYKESKQILTDRILILLCRLLPPCLFAPDENGFEMVWDLQKRFESLPEKTYRLASLAKEYHVSPSSLSHHFKTITGSSVVEYLMFCRLAAAKEKLLCTRLCVGEIAEASGFGDASNFSRYFKEKEGLSPSAFRKKYRS